MCKLVTRGHALRSLVTLLVAAYPDGHDREEGCTLVAAVYGMFCSLVAGDGEAVDELQAMGLRHVELKVGPAGAGAACVHGCWLCLYLASVWPRACGAQAVAEGWGRPGCAWLLCVVSRCSAWTACVIVTTRRGVCSWGLRRC